MNRKDSVREAWCWEFACQNVHRTLQSPCLRPLERNEEVFNGRSSAVEHDSTLACGIGVFSFVIVEWFGRFLISLELCL
jgi:hypothetical protein